MVAGCRWIPIWIIVEIRQLMNIINHAINLEDFDRVYLIVVDVKYLPT